MRYPITLAALALCVSIGVAAQAQEKDLTSLSLEDFLNVEVVSVRKSQQKLSRTSAAVYVITQDDIRRSGATSLPDALRLAPGIHVARLNGSVWAVGMRGFNNFTSNQLLVGGGFRASQVSTEGNRDISFTSADRTYYMSNIFQVRAAFLYQLAQYVTWPGNKRVDPLRFCVLGNDQLADMLGKVLKGKSIQERPLTAIKLTGPEQLAGCDVAFLAFPKRKQLQELLAHWSYPPVLLVGETDGFAELGGMVNLKIDEGRVSIEINLNATRRAGLDMRSQLLRLALIVPEAGGKP